MRANPCRYCALADIYKNHHVRGWGEACLKCEYIKKHEAFLEENRRFIRGERIDSLEELLAQERVFIGFAKTSKHIEVIKSWQLRIVLKTIETGNLYKAIDREREEE